MNWIFIAVHGLLVAMVCGAQALQHVGFITCGLINLVACGIFSDQGSNLHLLDWQADSLPLSHQGSPLDSLKHKSSFVFVMKPGPSIN